MRTVELRTAYCWHCDECSELNFEQSIKHECAPDEKEEIFRYFHEMDEFEELPEGWEQFDTCYSPETVKCSKCGTEFNAIDERDADEDD